MPGAPERSEDNGRHDSPEAGLEAWERKAPPTRFLLAATEHGHGEDRQHGGGKSGQCDLDLVVGDDPVDPEGADGDDCGHGRGDHH